jgi:DNA-binding LacI/PurR family transcriptional regulator
VLYLGTSQSVANRWPVLEPACRAAGLEPHAQDFPRELGTEEFCNRLEPLLEAESAATPIFAHGRHLAGLYGALWRRGDSIPADRSVITFSESRLTQGLTDPTPAAIHVDTVEVGRRAIGILDA